jgi:hypothetical protein
MNGLLGVIVGAILVFLLLGGGIYIYKQGGGSGSSVTVVGKQ